MTHLFAEGSKWMVRGVYMLPGIAVAAASCSCSGASNVIVWKEEVKLNSGATILVEQQRDCRGGYTGGNVATCIVRDAWLTFSFDGKAIEPWHERLTPTIVNIDGNILYVVATFPTCGAEFKHYGSPRHPYVGFKYVAGSWMRIEFEEIPSSIYATNLLLENIPPKGMDYVTLAAKNQPTMNGNPEYMRWSLKVDPNFPSSC